MGCCRDEADHRERFSEAYQRARAPVMREVERQVLGCDYGGTSWTTKAEAERIAALLELRPGLRLLEVGAGSGWPGLYLAEISGCDVTLTDLPLSGLRLAAERARETPGLGACWIACADGAALPFPAESFDAISHSDVLCCLPEKRRVLTACREVVRDKGRMVFTVISLAPSLSPAARARALENGPPFIAAECDYPQLLQETGWRISDHHDLTDDYAAACRRQLAADAAARAPLEALLGATEYADRQTRMQSKLAAIGDGLLRRELFVATAR